ncbi:hypothetical protein YC2023_063332 [Brassica napus]
MKSGWLVSGVLLELVRRPSPELYIKSFLVSLHMLLVLVRCPFDPNHLMPPEALVLHSLRCPSTLDLTPLLGSFSSYRNTLELPCETELNNGDGDLCFSLDDVTDFFYNDCPGAVNFSDLDGKTRRFTLPTVLSVECSELEGSSVLEKSFEIGGWRDYPISYSYSVLCSILGSEAVEISELRAWILVNSTRYGVVIDTYMSDHVLLLFRLSMKAVVKEAIVFMLESDANVVAEERIFTCKSRTYECPVLFRVLSWLASRPPQ